MTVFEVGGYARMGCVGCLLLTEGVGVLQLLGLCIYVFAFGLGLVDLFLLPVGYLCMLLGLVILVVWCCVWFACL